MLSRKYLNICRTVSVLAMASSLASAGSFSAWATSTDEKETPPNSRAIVPGGSSLSARAPSFSSENSAETYSLATLKGVPLSYETKVSSEEWKNFIDKLNLKLKATLGETLGYQFSLQKWTKVQDKFFFLYTGLSNKYKQTLKQLKNNPARAKTSFFEPCLEFVVVFEGIYGALLDNLPEEEKGEGELEKLLSPVQKTWNLYMKAYQDLTNTTTGFFGELYFSKLLGAPTNLFYTRDEGGFLLFSAHPAKEDQIDENLYAARVLYGQRADNFFHDRQVLFFGTEDASFEVVDTSGFIVKRSENIISLTPYTGANGIVPYSVQKTCQFLERWNKSRPDVINKQALLRAKGASEEAINEFIKNALPPSATQGMAFFTFISDAQLSSNQLFAYRIIEQFASVFLGDSEMKFLPLPSTSLEHMETTYLFLTDLQQKLKKDSGDLDAQYALTWVQTAFPDKSLSEIIEEYGHELEDIYEAEEKEKIRLEQEKRSNMVATGAHYKPKVTKVNKRKPNNKRRSKQPVRTQKATSASASNVNKQALAAVKRRMDALEDALEGKKKLAFRQYLAIINIAVKELREAGIPVKAELHRSSHGALQIGKEVVPLYRPHGEKEKPIHKNTLSEMLNSICAAYVKHCQSLAETSKD